MPSIATLYTLGLLAYGLGCVGGLAAHFLKKAGPLAASLLCALSLSGAILQFGASLGALLGGGDIAWSLVSGVPYLHYGVRLDALSAFFNLTLSLLSAAVSVYSFGYIAHSEIRKRAGLFCFFFNLLLLSLTLVFTASNVLFFLIVWELTAVSAYFLVAFDHESEEARKGGLLYLLMSRGGSGMMLVGFLLLGSAAGSLDADALHGVGQHLSPVLGAVTFLLLFFGFGVKAGIIPLHIWLPAAHPVAPSNVSALLSGIVIKAGIYGMARVFFDFYGELPVWAGMLVLVAGVISALLGVLYALMEHDLKRLLAYHSIENIGIILMGFGSALLFRSFGHPQLAALALIAGLFHTLNHGLFKCLLFLGAGGVLHAAHTRNMEEMGGLIRRMPMTALYFLIGAIAISGLPPLNGFVSEWLTYQALLAGFGATPTLTRLAFPVAGALLALTAALAAACFVKAFGITFLAFPRSEKAENAKEVSFSMRSGMAILALACVALGLGATWFLPVFDQITVQAFGIAASKDLVAANGLVLTPGSLRGGSVSTAVIALLLLALGTVPLVLWLVWGRKTSRVRGPAWDCGQPGLTSDNEYTATAFSKPLRMIFAALFRPRREIQTEFEVSAYYPKAIHFESEIEPTFETHFYGPLREGILWASSWVRRMQAGSIHAYLAYIFATLILLLLFGVRE
ncbi:MAG TPA: hydrogenase 4 subunit B [Bryobacteraceae bacterium]|nr:hydrogenase 4 subunit B [Bryobacteraceae bacterium]